MLSLLGETLADHYLAFQSQELTIKAGVIQKKDVIIFGKSIFYNQTPFAHLRCFAKNFDKNLPISLLYKQPAVNDERKTQLLCDYIKLCTYLLSFFPSFNKIFQRTL